MFLIKGVLPNKQVVKMKSEAGNVYDAAKEFFSKLSGTAKETANKMPSLSFKYRDSAQDSFVIADVRVSKKGEKKPTVKK